jgi:hypothetical protein
MHRVSTEGHFLVLGRGLLIVSSSSILSSYIREMLKVVISFSVTFAKQTHPFQILPS